VLNPSFETGDFTNWTTIANGTAGSGETVAVVGVDGAIAPTNGSFMARLRMPFNIAAAGATYFTSTIRSSTFSASVGATVSVNWRPVERDDDTFARGQLIDATTTAVIATFFNGTFNGDPGWQTANVTVTSGTGSYYLEFQGGSFDATFGTVLGADLYIDNVLCSNIDFGDAPVSYGAVQHEATGVRLGASRDAEATQQFSAGATGDDVLNTDDENGFVSQTDIVPFGTARVVVNASGAGRVDAWIDFDNNGSFSAGERITPAVGTLVAAGNNNIDFNVPSNAVAGNRVMRLRISAAGGLGPTGAAVDGEVEDHLVSVLACPLTVYVDDSWAALAPGTNVDGDTFAGGFQSAFIGSTAFATIQQAIDAVCPGGTVIVNPGTYPENVLVNKTITLDGANPDKSLAVIDPAAGIGINVTANGVTIRDLRVTGATDGIFASGVSNLTLNNVLSDFNSDDGFDGDNLLSTLNIINGCYNDNSGNGLELDGVPGVTIANVNGTEARRNVGNGLIATEMLQLTLTGGLYTNNSGAGSSGVDIASIGTFSANGTTANNNQSDGINVLGGVGSATFTNVTARSNVFDGLNADTAGGTITITGGNYSDNNDDGIELIGKTLGGAISGVTANNNGQHGLVVLNNTNGVSVSGGTYNSNGRLASDGDGVHVDDSPSATLTNVTANSNRDDGADIDDVTFANIAGGSYSTNGNHGLELFGGAGLDDLNRTARVTTAQILGNTNAGIYVDGDTNPFDCDGDTVVNIGFTAADLPAGNRIEGNAVGIDVFGGCAIARFNDIGIFGGGVGNVIGARLSEVDGFLMMECNQIRGNGTGVTNAAGGGTTVAAIFNWWGGGAPNTAGNDTTSGSVDFAPWAINSDCTGVPPPTITNEGDLVVAGTGGRDTIVISQVGLNTEVKINAIPKFTFLTADITGHLIVYSFAGNDSITINGTKNSEIHAGAGRDVVSGGSAKDIIWGDDGDDFLQGQLGHDVLIGGRGRDRLTGGSGLDILVGGEFCKGNRHNGVEAYDYDVLCAISDNYVNNGVQDADLVAGLADDLDDDEQDRMTGGFNSENPAHAGRGDWFIGNILGGTLPLDILTDFLPPADKRTSF
jgi:hypothetical protein